MTIRSAISNAICLLAGLFVVPWVWAGGFQIAVELPDQATAALVKNAVMVVRTYGCHTPSDADLTATAEGLVNGHRQSVPLRLEHAATGVVAISRQWPSEGVWVVAITGKYRGLTSSALVEIGRSGRPRSTYSVNGVEKKVGARIVQRDLSTSDIESALKGLLSS